jgi:integral membrane sensor domain MASE1
MNKYFAARMANALICLAFLGVAACFVILSPGGKSGWWVPPAILAAIGLIAGARWWHWSALSKKKKGDGQ